MHMLCRNRQKFDSRIPWNNYYFPSTIPTGWCSRQCAIYKIWSEGLGFPQPLCTWVITVSNSIGWWLDTSPCPYDFSHPRVIMAFGKWIIKPINLRFTHIVTATLYNNMDFQPLLKRSHCLWGCVGFFYFQATNPVALHRNKSSNFYILLLSRIVVNIRHVLGTQNRMNLVLSYYSGNWIIVLKHLTIIFYLLICWIIAHY